MNTRLSFLGSYFRRKSTQVILEKILVYILLLTMGIIFIFPLFWMVATSFKDEAQLYIPKPKMLPNPLVWANYKEAWEKIPFALYMRNTTIITLSSVFLAVLSTSLVAFGFARINFKGRNFLFSLLLASMILPGMVQIIPRYFIWNWLHCLDTWIPLILPRALAGGFFVFL
ncbi:carbohydrate ABC transporter permease, partial [Candidatus Aerophobetes bacterium]